MKNFTGFIVFILCLGFLSGCSVLMAAKQPPKKDLRVLKVGTPRDMVLAEIGPPQWSEVKDGKRTDIFKFVQGYNTAVKASRALFHGVADVFTLGLWEVVGTPTEIVFHGKNSQIEVIYDENDNVESVKSLVSKE